MVCYLLFELRRSWVYKSVMKIWEQNDAHRDENDENISYGML